MSAETFGNEAQSRMQIAGEHLMTLLAADPRFCSHGRGVQVVEPCPEADDLVEALARILGVSACEEIPRDDAEAFAEVLASRGLDTDIIGDFAGGREAVEAARARIAARPLPGDLAVRIIDRASPPRWLEDFAAVSLAHGVLPPIGSVMRGISRPGFGMVAVDGNGRPVATSGAVRSRAPTHPDPHSWRWGQLATVADRMGEGIAGTLGALAIVHAAETFGATSFRTGIQRGNAASIRLCAMLGVRDIGRDLVIATDRASFGEGRMTK